jgi:predicted nucleotidyltransferase
MSAGIELSTACSWDRAERLARFMTAPTLAKIRARSEEIRRLAAARGFRDVRVYGSVARGADDPRDVDLLVSQDGVPSILTRQLFERALCRLFDCGWTFDVQDEYELMNTSPAVLQAALQDAIRL